MAGDEGGREGGKEAYLRLSVGRRGEERVEALLLEEVGGQASEAVSGVE